MGKSGRRQNLYLLRLNQRMALKRNVVVHKRAGKTKKVAILELHRPSHASLLRHTAFIMLFKQIQV